MKKPAARRRLPRDEREQLIAREAVAFFSECGFDGHTRELARRLGITQPLLYRYFRNKEALIDRVYQEVYLNRWNPRWEELLDDRTRPLEGRLLELYLDYSHMILRYEWIRIWMFSGLKGMDLNSRFLGLLRERIFARVIREIRHAHHLPSPDDIPISEMEFELVWALHASIFYIGVRRWIYGLEIPENTDAVVEALTRAFLDGVPAVIAALTRGPLAPATR
ncbi:MAG TPA: TetR/AcrR family transcriptional regulator [Candidatus Binatia bacterium]|nr:TetR/AcrR family transcriptional regulator [Candidatus Binatia bacterium]